MLPARSDAACFADATRCPDDTSVLFRSDRALRALARDPMAAIERVEGYDLALHYHGEPVVRPGVAKTLAVSLSRDDVYEPLSRIEVAAPDGWQAEVTKLDAGRWHFVLRTAQVAARNQITVTAYPVGKPVSAPFTLLGPDEAKGYPCNVNVQRCERCGARKEACVCPR